MELITKVVNPLNNFWVQDYNEKAKKLFIDLGFKEVQVGGFKPTFHLQFKGSSNFGFWSGEERTKILDALEEINPEYAMKELNWDGEIYMQNPYD
jgi:hypothetical protein